MTEICFFCDEEGNFVKAQYRYLADDNCVYCVCKKHSKLVKEAGKVLIKVNQKEGEQDEI
jgi:hypothetical protein